MLFWERIVITGHSSTVIQSTLLIYGYIKGMRVNTIVYILLFLSLGEIVHTIYTLVQVPSPPKTHMHIHTYTSYT